MRAIASRWFEVAMKYNEATGRNGKLAKKRATVTVSAVSFGEAEARGMEQGNAYASCDLEVTGVSIAPYREVFFSDNGEEDKWLKAKLAFITLDEKTGKEAKTTATYLVQGKDIQSAIRNIDEVFAPTMMDYYIVSLADTSVVEVGENIEK